MTAMTIENLVVNRGGLRAVNGVSFKVENGEVVALLGRNGAGKTTTVETACGLLKASHGKVRVLGFDPLTQHERLMPLIGAMPQETGLYPHVRVREIITVFSQFYADPEPTDALLERVGLAHLAGSKWRTLSGGEKQRLALALSLVGKPQVVFLDEPTAGIDPAGRQVVRRVVDELRTVGAAVLLTTHDLEEAERLADRVVIIDQGRVVANGAPQELMRLAGAAEILFHAPANIDTAALGRELVAAVTEVEPGEYVVVIEPTASNISTLTGWLSEHDLPLHDLKAGRQSLEELFLRLTAITGEIPAVKIGDD